MKLLRIGMILLVVGVSLWVATNARTRVVSTGRISNFLGLFGPYLFEPREIIIVLRAVTPPENLTLALVNGQSWSPPDEFDDADARAREADPAFEVSGLRRFDAVVFKIDVRGLYYILVTTETGEFTGETEVVVEQRGVAEDLLWASWTLIGIGVVVVVVDRVRMLRRRG